MSEYSKLDENSGREGSNKDGISPCSRATRRHFSSSKTVPLSLSEPLNAAPLAEENGIGERRNDPGDPFYVFRDDLCRKLELVDEALAIFLRVVHQTVSLFVFRPHHHQYSSGDVIALDESCVAHSYITLCPGKGHFR